MTVSFKKEYWNLDYIFTVFSHPNFKSHKYSDLYYLYHT